VVGALHLVDDGDDDEDDEDDECDDHGDEEEDDDYDDYVQEPILCEDGRVSKGTRKHAHACPVCQTVVWSSRSCGQIKGKHDTPAGKPCKTRKWHVPQEKDEKKR